MAGAQQVLTRDALSKADYVVGRRAFQMRCSACHTLAEGGSGLTGPNLWGVVGSKGGSRGNFSYSERAVRRRDHLERGPARPVPRRSRRRYSREPDGDPEGVPNPDRLALIAFLMLETGGADWPKPELPKARRRSRQEQAVAGAVPQLLESHDVQYRRATGW